ncbi:MAG TPA: hypothetical protein VF194_02345 [Ferrovibrio sp.]|uniref:hypothetical protein n=1 Tax=Ferrovibrio sp. TaxID=1917215 RepID=UPI002ED48543
MEGIGKIREFFAEHSGKYVVIGGAACHMIFSELGADFRPTKDVDMVLIVDTVERGFAQAFKAFLDAGQYEARERSDKRREFYRFHRPQVAGFPAQLEVFARSPDGIDFPEGTNIIPIEVEDDVLSLSAILLNDVYFKELVNGRREIDGVTVLNEAMLIPFKAFAHIQLLNPPEGAPKPNTKDIRKHRADVYRLLTLIPGDSRVSIPDEIKADLNRFIEIIQADGGFDPRNQDIDLEKEEGIRLLRSIYQLEPATQADAVAEMAAG